MTRITVERLEDWQGEQVLDPAGEQLGRVEELYFDARSGEPLLVAVKAGRLSRHARLVPIDGASVSRGHLRVAHPRDLVDGGAEIGGPQDLDEAIIDRVESVFGVKFPDEVELWSATEMAARRAEAEEARRRAEALEREAQERLAAHEAARNQAEGAAQELDAAERAAAEARQAAIEARRHADKYGGV